MLLIETQLFKPKGLMLSEGKVSERGNPLVEGILATAEIKNGNGRYYSKDLWEREINKYNNLVKDKRNYKVSSSKAQKMIKFSPKFSLEKGIKEMVNFTKKNKIKNLNLKKFQNILNSDSF